MIFELIEKERKRQTENIELIASENFTSKNVMNAVGSILTNKYAEGYPGKRYYGGCEVVDEIESLAIERAKNIFGCEFANVQPHSGAQANAAVMLALLKPGDTILGLDLSMGGHLTHGSSVNFSGQIYQAVFYGLQKETGLIDYDQLAQQAHKHKPKLIICGASAYSRDWDYERIRKVADEVDSFVLADISHPAGLIAKKLLNSPFDHCHVVTSTTHKTLRGPRGGIILMKKDFENPLDIRDNKGDLKMMSQLLNLAVFPGTQGGPLEHVIAGKAVAFEEILSDNFLEYSKQIISNAKVFCNCLQEKNYEIISNGTDNHLMLIDLSNKNISGKKAERILGIAGITLNKNMIPYDSRSAMITSGIRIGVPAITTRGVKEKHIPQMVSYIDEAITNADNEEKLLTIKKEVASYISGFPLPG